MNCCWCRGPITGRHRRWCSKRCRQTAWRARRGAADSLPVVSAGSDDFPLRLAYADPPYPGKAFYYKDHPDFGGEVDHVALLRRLATYDGWALSTSKAGMRLLLPKLPEKVLVCPWVKSHHQPLSSGPGNVHEYVLVSPGRRRLPGPPDALYASVARGGDSNLIGRKPIKFIFWVFALLGAAENDVLDDLYPGSGVIKRCWEEYRRSCREDVSGPPKTSPWSSKTIHAPNRLAAPVDQASRPVPGALEW